MAGAEATRVLFVDDDPLIRACFARSMRQAGFVVDVAESSAEALLLAAHGRYAVVVADWRMPGGDGLQLHAALQKMPQRPGFLLVTAADQEELRQKLAAGAAYQVFAKPWDDASLKQAVRREMMAFQSTRPQANDGADGSSELRRIALFGSGEIADRVWSALSESPEQGELRCLSGFEPGEIPEENDMDGIVMTGNADQGALDRVRHMSSLRPGMPIVVVSDSEVPPSAALPFIQAGAQDVLTPSDISAGRLERSVVQAIGRKRMDRKLVREVNHDALTGVGNRTLLTERLTHALARSRRAETVGAVLFLDLDHFKPINDTYGHDVGDALLQEVAARIQSSVRDTDTVARIGGDEFAVVLEGLDRPEGATLLAQRIVNSFGTPFMIGGHQLSMSTSIGIAVFPHNGTDADTLLKRADAAMYRSKATGRNAYQFFSEGLHTQAVRLERLQQEVRVAVEHEDFQVEYQPQVRLSDQQVTGVEAFLRWPRHDGISTTELVSVLEDTGQCIAVGDWLLRRVCAQLKAWNGSSGLRLRAAVNVGMRQLLSQNYAESVASALADYQLSPGALEIEIQESALLSDNDRLHATLAELRQLGVRLVLDDFGTGWSSLCCIQRHPVHAVKIDRSLVAKLSRDEQAQALTTAIVATARSLRLGVVAEGVETEEQLAFLRRERCTAIQGYYLTRPCCAREMTRWLAQVSDHGIWNEAQLQTALAVAG